MKAVLFDLDGTLTDRLRSLAKLSLRLAEHYRGHLEGIAPEVLHEAVRLADGGGYRDRAETFRDLAANLPWSSVPKPAEFWEFWDRTFPLCTVATEGTLELIDTLLSRRIAVGIVTNGGMAMQNTKIDVLGLRPYMRSIVISKEVGVEKPDPAIFRLALQQVDASPQETLFVGDNPIADVRGAEAAGMTAIWFEGLQSWPEGISPPLIRIASMNELIKYV